MKSLFHKRYRLSFLIIFILAISCKKDSYVDEENESVFPVNFTFSDFKSSTSYLKSASSKKQMYASTQIPANYSEGYIYFWSFNNENLTPDIKYAKSANPTITYNDGKIIEWGPGIVFEDYPAGRASNFVGPKQILIKLPIKDVLSISRFGFDMTGSATGPKDFEIRYSIDEGDTYKELSLVNQFVNVAASAKNSFIYNLEELELKGDEIWFKIDLKAGDRGNTSAYNESTGTLRIDNLHLVGIAPASNESFAINKLHYLLFHKTNGTAFQGSTDDINNLDVQLQLPIGEYEVLFVLNSSDEELIFPTDIVKASDIYISNIFSNKDAEIYGYSGLLEVTGNMSINIALQRMYSQVKVEFTDVELSTVKKIVVNQGHEPFFYSPFATGVLNPILDQTAFTIEEDFQANKQIVFNQFMGILAEGNPVKYNITVFGDSEVLRTFEISSSMKNNMQLVFRGELLEGTTKNVSFQITKNETWDGENEVSF